MQGESGHCHHRRWGAAARKESVAMLGYEGCVQLSSHERLVLAQALQEVHVRGKAAHLYSHCAQCDLPPAIYNCRVSP